jgi:predicted DCC family thiol-disulfide oxidoreductase YuxK
MDVIDKPIVFFDGVCGLCNSAVDYIIRNDKSKSILFSPLQGEYIDQFHLDINKIKPESLIFYNRDKFYDKSEAALEIAKIMGFPYSVLLIAKVIPLNIRNKIYDYIAKNRYKWFGKKENCRIPTKSERERFID